MALKTLPLTPNGKVDRAALPTPNETNTLRGATFAAPRTPTEEQIAGIASALLEVEQIGIDDNFFTLGGHSLLGAQLAMQVAHAFRVELPLRTLFEAPTVRKLAAEVERGVIAWLAAMSDDEAQCLLE